MVWTNLRGDDIYTLKSWIKFLKLIYILVQNFFVPYWLRNFEWRNTGLVISGWVVARRDGEN